MEKENKRQEKVTGSIAYSGGVKITLKSNGLPYKVIEQHNVGTAAFFTFILNCIRGVVIPKQRPYYIQLYDKSFTEMKVNANFILDSSSTPEVVAESGQSGGYVDDKVMASFTAEIPDNYISGRSFQGVKVVSYEGVEYARIALDDIIEVTGKNTNVVIDWTIYLGNARAEV